LSLKRRLSSMKKKSRGKKNPPGAVGEIDQKKKDRVAAILAVVFGLLAIRQGGGILLGVITAGNDVLTWLLWYKVVMGLVSVIAGVGMWMERAWSITLAVNILAFHSIVFLGLIGMYQLGQAVAMTSLLGMLLTTFGWIVIYSLLKWKRQERAGET
jgi:hypothetical protein